MTSTGESITALARRIEEYLREQPRPFLEAMTLTDEEVAGRDVLTIEGLSQEPDLAWRAQRRCD